MGKKASPPSYRDQLSEDQRPHFDQLKDLLQPSPPRPLMWYHKVGITLRAMRPEQSGYGEKWLRRLIQALSLERALAYRVLRFARLYGPKDVKRLERRGLRWNKVVVLLDVEDKARRDELEELTAEGKWSVRRLRDEAQCRKRGAAAGSEADRTPEVHLRRLIRLGRLWLDADEKEWSAPNATLSSRLRRLPKKRKTAGLLADLREAKDLLEKLGKAAGELARGLGQELDRSDPKPQ